MPDAEFSLEELTAWGEALGARLAPGTVVTLQGELGAGKTTLVQAICRGYGVHEPVTSPTFALLHEYQASRSAVLHLDLFRVETPQELANIGWEDVFTARALVLVEWAERAGADAARDYGRATTLRLSHVAGAPGRRRLSW
jgi:tRNA threonylcarbamoyladenosine biosynthesis protein TsaE